jgi:hypothetical protein
LSVGTGVDATVVAGTERIATAELAATILTATLPLGVVSAFHVATTAVLLITLRINTLPTAHGLAFVAHHHVVRPTFADLDTRVAFIIAFVAGDALAVSVAG